MVIFQKKYVSWDYYSPYMEQNKSHVPNHRSQMVIFRPSIHSTVCVAEFVRCSDPPVESREVVRPRGATAGAVPGAGATGAALPSWRLLRSRFSWLGQAGCWLMLVDVDL